MVELTFPAERRPKYVLMVSTSFSGLHVFASYSFWGPFGTGSSMVPC